MKANREHELILSSLKDARRIAGRWSRMYKSLCFDDLLGAAHLALCRAVRGYRAGTPWAPFARVCMARAVRYEASFWLTGQWSGLRRGRAFTDNTVEWDDRFLTTPPPGAARVDIERLFRRTKVTPLQHRLLCGAMIGAVPPERRMKAGVNPRANNEIRTYTMAKLRKEAGV